jgi:hypothetical protein
MALFPADRRYVPRHFDCHSARQRLSSDDAPLVPIAYLLLRPRLMRTTIHLVRGVAEGVFILLHDGSAYGLLFTHPTVNPGTVRISVCRTIIIAGVVISRVVGKTVVEDTLLFLLAVTPLLHLHRNRQSPNLYVWVFPGYLVELFRDSLVYLLQVVHPMPQFRYFSFLGIDYLDHFLLVNRAVLEDGLHIMLGITFRVFEGLVTALLHLPL